MEKISKHIEIVSSNETTLSSMSHKSRIAIHDVLSRHYSSVRITIVDNLDDLDELVTRKPDLVFLGMKFIPRVAGSDFTSDDKVWVSQYLEQHGIAYTGSGQVAHELELNKPMAKQRMLDVGLDTSKFAVYKQHEDGIGANNTLDYPLFIKPTNRGGGLGIDRYSVVHNIDQARSKIESIAVDLNSDALVEEYLSGREFSVAILKDEVTHKFKAMPIELVAPTDINGDRMLSGYIKSADAEQVVVVTDSRIRFRVCALALDAFHALGGRDYGRIDIRLDAAGDPQFLEANLLPSLISGYGSFPKSCKLNTGLDYDSMILTITRMGFSRQTDDELAQSYSTFEPLPTA
jgi:D-alanine-D-alanine ligase